MNQQEFVTGVQSYYKENDIQPGDPNEGRWEEAHYPLPKGQGDQTVLLLHHHHQIQGLLQSEEVGRCCFYSYDTKKFLSENFGCLEWFSLCEIHERWAKIRSQHNNEVLHEQKDERGRSKHAVETLGKAWGNKNSLAALERLRSEKDAEGRSVLVQKAVLGIRKKAPAVLAVSELGDVLLFPSRKEAARSLGIYHSGVSKSVRTKQPCLGYTFSLIEGPNPFY